MRHYHCFFRQVVVFLQASVNQEKKSYMGTKGEKKKVERTPSFFGCIILDT